MGQEQIELADLVRLVRECAGQAEGTDLDGDILDCDFGDLGYDSLALLEITGRVERDYAVMLDEEELDEAYTPRRYLDMVNRALSASRAAV
ncbi:MULTISPECIES: acyl carrier protein [unclassified Streptomyces]|uniref:acyl carrier protein n=1 Tax=unclassified Streptomyces TaxID=2593676 RepID=UPI002E2BBBE8|nr:acyl carrier protein [Streptomyces sp. NBC_00190]WSZ45655.1 acyl carrier protein [Streptomyces sp. NBC_00868]